MVMVDAMLIDVLSRNSASMGAASSSGPWLNFAPAVAWDRIIFTRTSIRFARNALTEAGREQHQDRGLRNLLRAAEHIAGLAADLPLCQQRDD